MASNNPISVGYQTIWASLNAWPAWAKAIRIGPNTQMNAQNSGYVPATNVMPSDRPGVKLDEGRILGLPYQRNSLVTSITVSYPLQLMSGAFTVDQMNLIYVVTLQALKNAGTHLGLDDLIEKWVFSPADTKQKDAVVGAASMRQPTWTTAWNAVLTFLILNTDYQNTTWT